MSFKIASSSDAIDRSRAPTRRYDAGDDYDLYNEEYMEYVESYRRVQRLGERAIRRSSVEHTAYARKNAFALTRILEKFRRAYESYSGEEFASTEQAMAHRSAEFMRDNRFEFLVDRVNMDEFRDYVNEQIESGDLRHERYYLHALDEIVRLENLNGAAFGRLVRSRALVIESLDTIVRERKLVDESFAALARIACDDPLATSIVGCFSTKESAAEYDMDELTEGQRSPMRSEGVNLFLTAGEDDAKIYKRFFEMLSNNSYVRSLSFGPMMGESKIRRGYAAQIIYNALPWNRSITRIRFRDAYTVMRVIGDMEYVHHDMIAKFGGILRTMTQLETLIFDGYPMRYYTQLVDKVCAAFIANALGLRYLTSSYMGILATRALTNALRDRTHPISELSLVFKRQTTDVRDAMSVFVGYNGEGKHAMYNLLGAMASYPWLRRVHIQFEVDRKPTRRFISLIADLAGVSRLRELNIWVSIDFTQNRLKERDRLEEFVGIYGASADNWVATDLFAFGKLYRALKRNENLVQFDIMLTTRQTNTTASQVARVFHEFNDLTSRTIFARRAASALTRVNDLTSQAMAVASKNRSIRWLTHNVNPNVRRLVEDKEKRVDEARKAYENYESYLSDSDSDSDEENAASDDE